MKFRKGFVSNSSSTSFVIEFDKDKEISIKMPLIQLLKHFGTEYGNWDEEPGEFTKQSLANKEDPGCWNIRKLKNNRLKVKGDFRHNGDGPNNMESLITDLYKNLEEFFKENEIKIKEIYEE